MGASRRRCFGRRPLHSSADDVQQIFDGASGLPDVDGCLGTVGEYFRCSEFFESFGECAHFTEIESAGSFAA